MNRLKVPKVFLSYSREKDLDPSHRVWVHDFATRLRTAGIESILDQWHAVPGDQLPEFMERAVRDSDFVLIVCTPRYKERSDARTGGVGYEGDVMTAEALTTRNNRKFIPLLRRGEWLDAAPSWLRGKVYLDFRNTPPDNDPYHELIATLLGTRAQAPTVQKQDGADPAHYTPKPVTPKSIAKELPDPDTRWELYIPTWEDEEYREGEQRKRALRIKRGLKPLSEFQEGLAASAVDPGTHAVLLNGAVAASSAFIRLEMGSSHSLKVFEVHTLHDRVVEIVGFTSPQDAHALRSRAESRVSIFSRKTRAASELVTLDITRIIAHETHLVRGDTYRLDARIKPAA